MILPNTVHIDKTYWLCFTTGSPLQGLRFPQSWPLKHR